jgi:hypothetical protein
MTAVRKIVATVSEIRCMRPSCADVPDAYNTWPAGLRPFVVPITWVNRDGNGGQSLVGVSRSDPERVTGIYPTLPTMATPKGEG